MDSVGAERFPRPREVLMRYEHSSGTATQGDTEGQRHCRGWLAQRMDNLLYKPGSSARGICDLHLQSRFGIWGAKEKVNKSFQGKKKKK